MRFRLLIPAIVLAASTVTASATSITYTESFLGVVTLNGVRSQQLQLVTITGVGDTNNVTFSSNEFSNIVTATVQIESGSVDPFTDSMEVRVASFPAEGEGFLEFVDATKADDVFGLASVSLLNYDLQGAINSTDNGVLLNQNFRFPTALGNFGIMEIFDNTFTATLAPTATPEPSTLALFGTGILGLAGVARRRFS